MFKKIKSKLISLSGARMLGDIRDRLKRMESLFEGVIRDDYIESKLAQEKYADPKSLSRSYGSVWSQNGEDGILREIFRRIQTKSSFFVEFGAHGFDNNSTLLLHKGWKGLWIEGDRERCEKLSQRIVDLGIGSLRIVQAFITAENFESLLKKNGVQEEFDLLSVDIDGNDYHVFKSMQYFRPRVIVIEYNASFGATEDIVIKYNPNFQWGGDSYYGASLCAISRLAGEKGYSLVGCDLSGTNAFLVRSDLVGDLFMGPYTAETHYEPPRYFLSKSCPPGFGRFESCGKGQ